MDRRVFQRALLPDFVPFHVQTGGALMTEMDEDFSVGHYGRGAGMAVFIVDARSIGGFPEDFLIPEHLAVRGIQAESAEGMDSGGILIRAVDDGGGEIEFAAAEDRGGPTLSRKLHVPCYVFMRTPDERDVFRGNDIVGIRTPELRPVSRWSGQGQSSGEKRNHQSSEMWQAHEG